MGPVNMDIQELRYFIAVVEAGGFSKAATKLKVAQPTLSRQILKMEQELNAELFYRHGRGTALTIIGKELYDTSRIVLQQLDDIKQKILAQANEPKGLVRFGVPPSIANALGAPLVCKFQKHCPGAHLHVLQDFSGHLPEWVEAGRIDLAVLYEEQRSQNVRVFPIMTEDLFLIGPRSERSMQPLSLSELSSRPLVLPGKDTGLRHIIDAAFDAEGITPQIISAEIDSIGALKHLVQMGSLQTILPFGTVHREVASGDLTAHPLSSPAMRTKLFLATPLNKPVSKATLALSQFVHEEFSHGVAAGILKGTLIEHA
jgi:LysR family transcriptional regulator, nitrogen assimilation regulatory protein